MTLHDFYTWYYRGTGWVTTTIVSSALAWYASETNRRWLLDITIFAIVFVGGIAWTGR